VRFFEWFLCTIQYKSPRAYGVIKEGKRKGEANANVLFENSWFFKLQRIFWDRKHKRRFGYSEKEVTEAYYSLLETLALKSENTGCIDFVATLTAPVHVKTRLAGGTIVIDETWAINSSPTGIAVHWRGDALYEWTLVYRSGWLMVDGNFIGLLLALNRHAWLISPVLSKDDSSNAASKAAVD
jgi:hypothetical protein